jgi:hypothetical protein
MSQFRRENAFKKWTDIWHAFLGFTAGLVARLIPYGNVIAFTMTIIYVVYQSLEAETPIDSYCDLVEYLVGLALAALLLW